MPERVKCSLSSGPTWQRPRSHLSPSSKNRAHQKWKNTSGCLSCSPNVGERYRDLLSVTQPLGGLRGLARLRSGCHSRLTRCVELGLLCVSALLSTRDGEGGRGAGGSLVGAGLGSLVVCAVPGTQWVPTACLLLMIKPALFIPGPSPKTTLYTQNNLNYSPNILRGGLTQVCKLKARPERGRSACGHTGSHRVSSLQGGAQDIRKFDPFFKKWFLGQNR